MFRLLLLAAMAALIYFLIRVFFKSQALFRYHVAQGKHFLHENAYRENIKTLPSGLQYQWLHQESMDAGVTVSKSDKITVHYQGQLIDGTVFDSSLNARPLTIDVNKTIKAWQEVLPLMVVGDRLRLFAPQQLAYGSKKVGKIPPGACLIFDIELLDIVH